MATMQYFCTSKKIFLASNSLLLGHVRLYVCLSKDFCNVDIGNYCKLLKKIKDTFRRLWWCEFIAVLTQFLLFGNALQVMPFLHSGNGFNMCMDMAIRKGVE